MDFFFRHFGALFVLAAILGIAFWATVIFVIIHFVAKVW